MAKKNIKLTKEFADNVSLYLNEVKVNVSRLKVRIYKTKIDINQSNYKEGIIGEGSTLYDVLSKSPKLFSDGCADILFENGELLFRVSESGIMFEDKQLQLLKKRESQLEVVPLKKWREDLVDDFVTVYFYRRRIPSSQKSSVKIGRYWKRFNNEMVWCVDTIAYANDTCFSLDQLRYFRDGRVLKNHEVFTGGSAIKVIVDIKDNPVDYKPLNFTSLVGLF